MRKRIQRIALRGKPYLLVGLLSIVVAYVFEEIKKEVHSALILYGKQDQANHEHGDAEQLIFSESLPVHNHAEYHDDKSITGSNG